jgi:2'-5' RNA ligase
MDDMDDLIVERAIEIITQLRKERDEIERLRADVMCLKYQNAEFVRHLTMAQDERNAAVAERDDALEQAKRWEDDVLRLLNERNAAQEECEELRRIAKEKTK